jgi:hypothetical protein
MGTVPPFRSGPNLRRGSLELQKLFRGRKSFDCRREVRAWRADRPIATSSAGRSGIFAGEEVDAKGFERCSTRARHSDAASELTAPR